MLEQPARVVSSNATSVEVCAQASAGCSRCERGQGCGGGLIGALMERNERQLTARCSANGFEAGDPVTLRLRPSILLEAAAWTYLFPLATMFFGLSLTGVFLAKPSDGLMAVIAALGLVVGGWVARRYQQAVGQRRWQPRAVACVPSTSSGPVA